MGAKKFTPVKIPGVKSKCKLHGPTLLTARAPSLVTAVTGGPVPVLPGGSGVVLPALLRREELEAEMRKICKEKLKLERFELPRAEAIAFMEELLLPGKGHAVDPLKGLAAGIPPPVGGVAGGELDGVIPLRTRAIARPIGTPAPTCWPRP